MRIVLAVVPSDLPACKDNARFEKFLRDRVKKGIVVIVPKDSERAKKLWSAAQPALKGKTEGHPLVSTVIEIDPNLADFAMLDAAVEPSVEQLEELGQKAKFEFFDEDDTDDTSPRITQYEITGSYL